MVSILQTGLSVARHDRKGPANYVKLHSSVNIGLGAGLGLNQLGINLHYLPYDERIDGEQGFQGMRIERDDTLSGKFIVGRDCDGFEIEGEYSE